MAVQLTALELSNTYCTGNAFPHGDYRSHPKCTADPEWCWLPAIECILCHECISQSKS
jgi:hypothetical protein